MFYANIKKYDVANGVGVRVSLVRQRLHPPLQGVFQRRGVGFFLRQSVYRGDGRGDSGRAEQGLHRGAVPPRRRAVRARRTSARCCRSSGNSASATRKRTSGAIPAIPSIPTCSRAEGRTARRRTRCSPCSTSSSTANLSKI